MDFTLTEAQRELGGLAGTILADKAGAKPAEVLAALAGAGVLAAALPEAAGGDGLGLLEQCAVLVEVGRAAAPVPYLPSIVVAASAIALFGNPEQIARWAAPAGRGDAVLTAALEEDGTATATRSGDGWLLSGSVPAVPAAPQADLILVPTAAGVFLVATADPGVTVSAQQLVDGDTAGWLDLASVPLGGDRMLGGAEVAEWLRIRATVGLCATQLGVLERALELTASYARTREQFGRPIGSFQAVAQRLADAYIDVEAVRLTLWQAAWRLASGLPCPTEVGTAKFWAADAGHRVAHTAVHVHGGVGIDLEGPLHRYFVAAKYHEMALGGATKQLLRIGESLTRT